METFRAGFFAPGLTPGTGGVAIYTLRLPRGTGFFFDFRYLGPTLPFWGVFSRVPFPVTIATSIVDPLPSPLLDIPFGISDPLDPNDFASATLVTDGSLNSDFGSSTGMTPEPGTLGLIAAGLVAAGLFRRRLWV